MKARTYSSYMAFDAWRSESGFSYFGPHLWPQVTYDSNNGKPFLFIFEKNRAREAFVKWPVDATIDLKGTSVPLLNIDFTGSIPRLQDGSNWDWKNFYKELTKFLGRNVIHEKQILNVPKSFWDYRLASWPSENKTCDIDSLEISNVSGTYFGVEATRFNHRVDTHIDAINYLLGRIFLGRPKGFNVNQLKAQIWTLTFLGGSLYMVIHHNNGEDLAENENALFLNLNQKVYKEIIAIVNSNGYTSEQVDIFLNNSKWDVFLSQYQSLMSQ